MKLFFALFTASMASAASALVLPGEAIFSEFQRRPENVATVLKIENEQRRLLQDEANYHQVLEKNLAIIQEASQTQAENLTAFAQSPISVESKSRLARIQHVFSIKLSRLPNAIVKAPQSLDFAARILGEMLEELHAFSANHYATLATLSSSSAIKKFKKQQAPLYAYKMQQVKGRIGILEEAMNARAYDMAMATSVGLFNVIPMHECVSNYLAFDIMKNFVAIKFIVADNANLDSKPLSITCKKVSILSSLKAKYIKASHQLDLMTKARTSGTYSVTEPAKVDTAVGFHFLDGSVDLGIPWN